MSQRHSFEHQASTFPDVEPVPAAPLFRNEIAARNVCRTALRLDGRVLPRARANGVLGC